MYVLLTRLGIDEKIKNNAEKVPLFLASNDLKKAIKIYKKMNDQELLDENVPTPTPRRKRSLSNTSRAKTAYLPQLKPL